LVKALIITLDQVLTGFLSLTSKLKQGTPIFKESKIFDAYFFSEGLNMQLMKSTCRFPIFQTTRFFHHFLSLHNTHAFSYHVLSSKPDSLLYQHPSSVLISFLYFHT